MSHLKKLLEDAVVTVNVPSDPVIKEAIELIRKAGDYRQALEAISYLWPSEIEEVDKESRAILLKGAINIARKALGKARLP